MKNVITRDVHIVAIICVFLYRSQKYLVLFLCDSTVFPSKNIY